MCSLLYDATYVLRIGVVDASMTIGMGGAHWTTPRTLLRIGVVDISMTMGGLMLAAARHCTTTHTSFLFSIGNMVQIP